MNLLQRLSTQLNDPEEQRRQRINNTLLLGIAALCFVVLVYGLQFLLYTPWADWVATASRVVFGVAAVIVVAGPLLWINRRRPKLAAQLLTALVTIGLLLVDSPEQVLTGRSLFLLTTPIILAALTIGSTWAWGASMFISLALVLIAQVNHLDLPAAIVDALGLNFVALIAWLTSRSLEQSIAELNGLNAELDKRVVARTHDLNEALARERAEASKSRTILDSITDGIILFGADGRARAANPAIASLLGMEPGLVLGAELPNIMVGRVTGKEQESLLDHLRTAPTKPLVTRLKWDSKTLSVNVAPVLDEANQVLGSVTVFRDSTQEAELERLKTLFLSMVSHELRTPLNSIMGYAEMLLDRVYGPLLERQQEIVGRVFSNTQRLLRIVNDLLDQTQLEAGRLLLHPAVVEPAALLTAVNDMLSGFAQAKQLRISMHLEPEVPAQLRGDPQRVQQILVNLVTNAIRYTEKGEIKVRLFRPDATQWGIAVTDTGIGISREAQSYIFEAFRQVRVSTEDTRSRGVGLGLSIVKHLVDLMGGRITVVSAPEQGSTFTVILPLIVSSEASA